MPTSQDVNTILMGRTYSRTIEWREGLTRAPRRSIGASATGGLE